jgi:hypothetical protein
MIHEGDKRVISVRNWMKWEMEVPNAELATHFGRDNGLATDV